MDLPWPNVTPASITKSPVKKIVRMGAISQEKRRPKAPFGILMRFPYQVTPCISLFNGLFSKAIKMENATRTKPIVTKILVYLFNPCS